MDTLIALTYLLTHLLTRLVVQYSHPTMPVNVICTACCLWQLLVAYGNLWYTVNVIYTACCLWQLVVYQTTKISHAQLHITLTGTFYVFT